MSEGKIILGANQYGKAEVRLVKVTRDTARHEIEDLNITSQLRGDFQAAHIDGDNAHVVATDTQKNTVYAFARDGVGAPEDFLLRLGQHFIDDFDWVSGGRWSAEKYPWSRIEVGGGDHDHAFVRGGTETRTAVVTLERCITLGGEEVRDGETAGVRDVLVHMVEEYARHCGHADLLRECIDGRTGQ